MNIQWIVQVNDNTMMLVNAPISTDAINKAAKEYKKRIGDDSPIFHIWAQRVMYVVE